MATTPSDEDADPPSALLVNGGPRSDRSGLQTVIGAHLLQRTRRLLMSEERDRRPQTSDLQLSIGECSANEGEAMEFRDGGRPRFPFLSPCALGDGGVQFFRRREVDPILAGQHDDRRFFVAEKLLEEVHALSVPDLRHRPWPIRFDGVKFDYLRNFVNSR